MHCFTRTLLPALALLLAACGPDQTTVPAPNPASADSPVASAPQSSSSASAATSAVATPSAAATPSASASSSSGSAARYEQLSDADVAKLVKPQLETGESLAHPAYRGPFGPSQSTIVAITKKEVEGLTQFGGFLLFERGGKTEKLALPQLHDQHNGVSIDAIAFLPEADADKVEEAVILGSYMTGMGKDGAKPYFATSVIDVNGTDVVRLRDMEALAGDRNTIGAVRQAFKSTTFVMRLDGAPMLFAPTLDHDTALARLRKVLGKEPVSDTPQRLQFDYGNSQGGAPVSCILAFGERGLASVTVASHAEGQDSSAKALEGWLLRRGVKLKAQGEVRRASYNGWSFQMRPPSADAAKPALVISR